MATEAPSDEENLRAGAARLLGKGLMSPGSLLSQRIPERNAFVSLRLGPDGEMPAALSWEPLSGAPTNMHHQIYRDRADVGAILSGALVWTGALSRLGLTVPAIFDEQVRQLGREVKRVPMRLSDNAPLAALANHANAYGLDDGALALGMGLERLLMNVEILEKCAQCFVLATITGGRVHQLPWLVRHIASGRLRKDQKDAAARHARGERSLPKAGY